MHVPPAYRMETAFSCRGVPQLSNNIGLQGERFPEVIEKYDFRTPLPRGVFALPLKSLRFQSMYRTIKTRHFFPCFGTLSPWSQTFYQFLYTGLARNLFPSSMHGEQAWMKKSDPISWTNGQFSINYQPYITCITSIFIGTSFS